MKSTKIMYCPSHQWSDAPQGHLSAEVVNGFTQRVEEIPVSRDPPGFFQFLESVCERRCRNTQPLCHTEWRNVWLQTEQPQNLSIVLGELIRVVRKSEAKGSRSQISSAFIHTEVDQLVDDQNLFSKTDQARWRFLAVSSNTPPTLSLPNQPACSGATRGRKQRKSSSTTGDAHRKPRCCTRSSTTPETTSSSSGNPGSSTSMGACGMRC